MFVAIVAAAALGQAALGAAPSASAPLATPNATPASPSGDDKMICRVQAETGSMFAGPKECHTKREWDAINAESRDNTSDYQRRSTQSGSLPH